jgi:hypothetical protein
MPGTIAEAPLAGRQPDMHGDQAEHDDVEAMMKRHSVIVPI